MLHKSATAPLQRSLGHLLLLAAASAASVNAELNPRGPISQTLGLDGNNLQANGIALGFLPAWGEPMAPNTPAVLNALLPKPMSVVGAYAQISNQDPSFTQLDWYVNATLQQPGNPVLALALMPSQGLGNITQAVANSIGAKMLAINNLGLTVWLRYAHEMNGDWYAWGQQPAAFLASWNMVTNAVRAHTNNTLMLWSPNEMYAFDGNVANPIGGYTAYWPGKNMVDIVGLSFYHYGSQQRLNNLPDVGEAMGPMKFFDSYFGSKYNLPVVLSETGASYTRDAQTGVPAAGSASEADIKTDWLLQISGPQITEALPTYRAACWFEVLKDENAGYGTIVKEEDFRIIDTNATNVAHQSLAYIANPDNWVVNGSSLVWGGGISNNGSANKTANSTSKGVGANANANSNSTTAAGGKSDAGSLRVSATLGIATIAVSAALALFA